MSKKEIENCLWNKDTMMVDLQPEQKTQTKFTKDLNSKTMKQSNEILCKKPKTIKYFADIYEKYTNRFSKWRSLLPKNGDKIQITWFPDNRGVTNAYIGMQGIVEDMNTKCGTFVLNCGTCILICHGDFKYITK